MGSTADPGADVALARLAHQFRTALHAVAGFADLVAAAPLTADQQRDIDSLRAALRHVLALVDELLEGPGR